MSKVIIPEYIIYTRYGEVMISSNPIIECCIFKNDTYNEPYILKSKYDELLKEKEELEKENEWISVKDGLPKHNERVSVYRPLSETNNESIEIVMYGSLASGFPSGVTHWKPLPKAPIIKPTEK